MHRSWRLLSLAVALIMAGGAGFLLGHGHPQTAVAQEEGQDKGTGMEGLGAAMMGPLMGMLGGMMPGGQGATMQVSDGHAYIVSGGMLTKVECATLKIVGKLELESPEEAKARMERLGTVFGEKKEGEKK